MNRIRAFFRSPSFEFKETAGNEPEESSILNRQFAPYERFDLSTGQQYMGNSLQTLNGSSNLSIRNSFNGSNQFLAANSKRTLSTLAGVFAPITLSMFAISIFIRLSLVLAHAGVLQTLLQLGLSFLILFCTLLSVCSLATNGAIEGGGVYHMISRALGPEFGGAIGILLFLATIIGNAQSVAALVEALVVHFGPGTSADFFFDTHWWRFLYGTMINLVSLITCLLGASLLTTATSIILLLICLIFLMVIISFFVEGPMDVLIPKNNKIAYNGEALLYNKSDLLYGRYTGFNLATFKGNLYSNYTVDYTTGDPTDFAIVFGLLFSSITGLLAGANMSGEIDNTDGRYETIILFASR